MAPTFGRAWGGEGASALYHDLPAMGGRLVPRPTGPQGRFNQPRPKAWECISGQMRETDPERVVRRGHPYESPFQGDAARTIFKTQAYGLG